MQEKLDILGNRRSSKWSGYELVGRLLWGCVHPFFALSPRICWGWRRFLLRCFGSKIGRDAHICPSVRIAIPWNLSIEEEASVGDSAILYSLGPIHIGRQATISQYAHLCAGTHDFTRADMPLIKAPIIVGEGAWICAGAYVGPGIEINQFAIVGAYAVVVRDVPARMIVAGNPARVLRERPHFTI